MLLQLLQTSHTTWGHRYSNDLNFSWNVCYIQDSNVKFVGGRAGGGGGREYWVLLGVVEAIVSVGFIHLLFNLLY